MAYPAIPRAPIVCTSGAERGSPDGAINLAVQCWRGARFPAIPLAQSSCYNKPRQGAQPSRPIILVCWQNGEFHRSGSALQYFVKATELGDPVCFPLGCHSTRRGTEPLRRIRLTRPRCSCAEQPLTLRGDQPTGSHANSWSNKPCARCRLSCKGPGTMPAPSTAVVVRSCASLWRSGVKPVRFSFSEPPHLNATSA